MAGLQGTEFSFIGSGSVYLKVRGSAAPQRPIGNVSDLKFSLTEEKKELRDHQNAGGGMANTLRRISAVEMDMTMHDFVGANVALALFGSATAIAGASATDEPVTLYAGGLTSLAKINPSAVSIDSADGTAASARANSTAYALGDFYKPAIANGHYYKVTVAGTSAGAPPTFPTDGTTVADGTATVQDMGLIAYPTDGSYYQVTPGGIWVPDTATFAQISATQGVAALVDYTYSAQNVVQALVNAGLEYQMRFVGLNEAQSGKPVIVDVHKQRFGPGAELALITDDYGAIALKADVLKDTLVTGAGLSQYFVYSYVG